MLESLKQPANKRSLSDFQAPFEYTPHSVWMQRHMFQETRNLQTLGEAPDVPKIDTVIQANASDPVMRNRMQPMSAKNGSLDFFPGPAFVSKQDPPTLFSDKDSVQMNTAEKSMKSESVSQVLQGVLDESRPY